MTENEAILYIKKWYQPKTEPKEREKAIEALLIILKSIEEIQQYREIGTVKECREVVEKQKAKKPKLKYKPRFFGKTMYTCPNCGNCCLEEFANERQRNNYC